VAPVKDLIVSTTDLAIWFALIAGQGILCAAIVKRGLLRRLPLFSIYVFGATAETLILIAIAFLGSYETYYWAFYVTGHLVSVLALLTLFEFGRQVFPGLGLPQQKKALSWLIAALVVVVLFASTWPLRFIEKRLEVGGFLSIAVACIFIAGYSRYLGLYWSRVLGGVSITLGLLYLVEGVASAIVGHFPSAVVLQVRQLAQVANVAAVVAWTAVILSPWGEYKMTEDDLLQFQQIVGAAQQNVRRFVAGGSK
jgi:hypothetical protein